ncbi:MAG: M17 family peptidase N-terminal domain-containing protein, partial [Rhodoferax sp.]|nr:M17 family peptidase N-terminal domain-containing protein [Rhodoferax sp.]
MNFELKSFDLADAAKEKCDALVVLIGSAFKPGKDALSALAASALKAGDLENKAGKTLAFYRPAGLSGVRLVIAGVGEGTAKEVRQALIASIAAVKTPTLKKLVICFAGPSSEAAVRAAVSAASDATYVYTTTKSKPEGRTVQRVVLAGPFASKHQAVFDQTVAAVLGVEVAKEWANRPANYATPSLLAGAAKSLGKLP